MKQPKKCTKSTNKTATKGLSPYEMEELLSLQVFSAEEAKKVESELREWPFEVAQVDNLRRAPEIRLTREEQWGNFGLLV